jgi:teichuronic acid biosynthesis glycosyltransferase TuaG
LKSFKKYIKDCKNSISYSKEKIYNKYPYLALCLSAFNMERFIEKNLFSIINQSFQDFEIIIVNDASEDETENIIKKMQLEDDRIKLISHSKNLGVYRSRIESILNTKSKFILLMDPDDMYMNENLFQDLYNINVKQNFDIIEFSVFQQYEGRNKINYPRNDNERHFHKFSKDIIYQPELSSILFYLPGTNKYSPTICRNIWNKLIRKNIFLQINNYLGKEYYHKFIILADDMIMNIVSYQFAKNYTNKNIPGYLYTIRKDNIQIDNENRKLKDIRAMNYLLYFKLFYKYIHDYNKDINFLYFEMNSLNKFILYLKESKMLHYKQIQINLMQQILNEKNVSVYFKSYLENMLMYFKN